MSTKVDVGFIEWLKIVRKYDSLADLRLASIVLLLVVSFLVAGFSAPVGLSLFFGLGLAFLLALRHAWRRSCENPPWWLVGHIREAQKNAKTDDY